MDDLEILARHLKDYRIVVWHMQKDFIRPRIFYQENIQTHGLIPLLYFEGHFDFFVPSIKKVKYFYCFGCHDLVGKHHWKTCTTLCRRCGSEECKPDTNVQIHCVKCNISFHSQKCFDAHIKARSKKALPFCEKFEQ